MYSCVCIHTTDSMIGWIYRMHGLDVFFCYRLTYLLSFRYELHAIRLEKLKQIAIENKKDPNTSAYEVEMLESRKPTNLEPATPLE